MIVVLTVQSLHLVTFVHGKRGAQGLVFFGLQNTTSSLTISKHAHNLDFTSSTPNPVPVDSVIPPSTTNV